MKTEGTLPIVDTETKFHWQRKNGNGMQLTNYYVGNQFVGRMFDDELVTPNENDEFTSMCAQHNDTPLIGSENNEIDLWIEVETEHYKKEPHEAVAIAFRDSMAEDWVNMAKRILGLSH